MADEAREHGEAAREFCDALRAVGEARDALVALSRQASEYEDPSAFERPVEVYERACGRFCRAKEALDEAKSLDLRPLCVDCLRRLERDELTLTCSARHYSGPHRTEETTT